MLRMFGRLSPNRPRRVMGLCSGALQICQGGEFDYSLASLQAFAKCGIATVLINPNSRPSRPAWNCRPHLLVL